MCDTIVHIGADARPTWFAKNSDRAPAEPQVVEFRPGARHPPGAHVDCGSVRVPQAARTYGAILSRPIWMWGCEMGVNERGVAIGNEAVFTRFRVPRVGLTGMDLVRLALERADSARDALDIVTDLLAHFDQGGAVMYRNPRFRYHSSFAFADSEEAWILETAGPFWAAQRVRHTRALSNALSIGADFDLIHDRAVSFARSRGWWQGAGDFDFARCFGDRFYRVMSGAVERRACTYAATTRGEASLASLAAALRDHGGRTPERGWRSLAPCSHASWLPTRTTTQTTASLIAHLGPTASVWATGTSAPCLSVFKPVPFADECLSRQPPPGQRVDRDSLWWRQHRLHALVIGDYAARRQAFERERLELEARALVLDASDQARCAELWQEHRQRIPEWTARAARVGRARVRPFHLFWRAHALRHRAR